VKRREFMTLLGGATAAWPLGARAQEAARIPRIGYLSPGSASAGFQARDDAFRQALHDLGYVEGTIAVEYRFAEGRFDRLAELAAELVRLKVDVIVAVVTQASLAAKDATSSIPIVMVAVSDPVGSGLVTNLRHPGANVTGTSGMTGEVVGKSLQLLREAAPGISRVAVLWNPENAVFQTQLLRQAWAAAPVLGVQLKTFGMQGPDGLDLAFSAITAERVDALLVLADPGLALHQQRIVAFAERSRLPAMYGIKEFAASGGLMTYATNMTDQFRRAASYVDKIVKGAKAADLPVEQPTKFELVINLKAARALGLEISPTLLATANEVIDRREFITLLGGATAAWPLAARAQQPDQMRRIGMLAPLAESDSEGQTRIAALRKGLQDLGWTEGRNIRIDYRSTAGDPDRARAHAAELVALKPEVIVASTAQVLSALQRETRAVPIVFTQLADPVGDGFVASLARPGGNITGFMLYEFGIGVKWLELLKQIAPSVARVSVIYDPGASSSDGYLSTIEAAAPSLGVRLSRSAVRNTAEIETAVSELAAEPNGGLIVLPGAASVIHRELIVALEARHRLPAVHAYRYFVTLGGLASYGVDNIDLYSKGGIVHRSHPQGAKSVRSAGAGGDQVRAGNQPQDRQGAGP
jgi:ABC-type uncharacterized transport system substrate-binding protein